MGQLVGLDHSELHKSRWDYVQPSDNISAILNVTRNAGAGTVAATTIPADASQ